MKIRKVEPSVGILGKILNIFSNSNKDSYSCKYINDTYGGGVKNYSTDEVKLNEKWIDGKPIYRKVIKLTTYDSLQDIDITELNFETIMIKDVLIKYKNEGIIWFRPKYTWGTNTNEFLQAYILGKNLRFRYGNALLDILNKTGNVFYYTIAILEYTKTTD